MLHDAVLHEVLGVRVASSRGRRNQRGVKRKMSHYNLRKKGHVPQQWIRVNPTVRIIK